MGGSIIVTSRDLLVIGISFLLFLSVANAQNGSDAAALVAFKESADLGHVLDPNWNGTKADQYCGWKGVKECVNGSVTKLVLEHLQLNGTFAEKTLSRMDQLRVLSLKGNRLTGPIPDLSGLQNLKILFLDQNEFTGRFPESISRLRRLTVLVLADNHLSGEIPVSVTVVWRLLVFRVENNRLNGRIPELNQTGLGVLNVSNNRLSGSIPRTVALARFNSSSFLGNPGLCGGPMMRQCAIISSPSPAPGPSRVPSFPEGTVFFRRGSDKFSAGKIAGIVVGSTVGLAAIVLLILFVLFRRRRHGEKNAGENRVIGEALGSHELQSVRTGLGEKNTGKLVFCGGVTRAYSLEDLLRASAEVLGRGTIGTTYKAVMESGLIVTVKRLRNTNQLSSKEFDEHLETVGTLRHVNIISLRAYFQAKEERLLVYDYQPNGSLYSLIHGSRSSGGKPLHWTSCMKIAEDIANGLAYIHQASSLIHGNLKSSNVLLGKDFEACITDFGLTVFEAEQPEDASLAGYRAPECRAGIKVNPGAKADVYSYGVLLLELLTGKAPLPSFLDGPATDLPRWVRSVREEEMGSRVFEDTLSATDGSDDKLALLLNIATLCVSPSPDRRPTMREVLRMIEEEVKDTQISSDQSPRWSEAIHSFPRDNGSERSFGPERD